MNLRGSNNNIRARGQIGRGGLVGQRVEVMIKLGSKYYDAADASIGYEWAVEITFASQACSLHHRIDRARPRKEWMDRRARYFARSRLHHRRYNLLYSSLALRL